MDLHGVVHLEFAKFIRHLAHSNHMQRMPKTKRIRFTKHMNLVVDTEDVLAIQYLKVHSLVGSCSWEVVIVILKIVSTES